MKRRQIELLAPAGNKEAFIAAVQNGADAVYVGGNLYNARINADNFDENTMQAAIDYAHKRGVKIFVTMNTLLMDDELENALLYAKFLYEAGADALIIQDLGFGKLIKESLPDFEIHLSTQATSCDKYAVRAAGILGYKRVVLARELSIEEIKDICADKAADIEVFIHGAICICYSGQCQLSRSHGGRSGNRGECAQSCRLPYKVDGNASKNIYAFSPRDMCQIDNIGELIRAGVRSFKIEGRMKSPDYVGIVTSIYRKYIDKYLNEGAYTVSEEDRNMLLQIFNRGDFTDAYMHGDPGEELMSDFIPKNKGIFAGEVIGMAKDNRLVKITSNIDITMHDGIEIRKKDGSIASGGIITYLKPLEKNTYIIGDIKGKVSEGDLVYRTSSIMQLEAIRQTFKNIDIFSKEDVRYGRKLAVKLICTCYVGNLSLSAKADKVSASFVLIKNGEFDENPTPIDRYRQSLMKTGNTPFKIENIDFRGNFDIRVRTSEINELRRSCLEELEDKLCIRRAADFKYQKLDTVTAEYEELDNSKLFHTLEEYKLYRRKNKSEKNTILIPLADLCKEDLTLEEEYIPYISAVSRGLEDAILEEHYDRVLEIGKDKKILAGNLGWLVRLANDGVKVFADFGLNAYNVKTIEVLKDLGASGVIKSLEQGGRDGQNYPLMITEHNFDNKFLKSDYGHNLKIVKRSYSSQDIIINNN